MNRKKIFLQWVRILAGLVVFAFGIHLNIYANIGLAPWDCLGMGIARCTNLNYGLSMTAIALIVLIIDLFLKERIGYGTIIDALLTGNIVQLFNDLNPLPENHNVWLGIVIMLSGFTFVALGMMIYMKGAQCCGPKDSLLIGLGKRLPKIPIGIVEMLLRSLVLLVGWLLGGPIGIGTLIGTVGAGVIMHIMYSAMKFEPRDIKHRDVLEVTRELAAAGSKKSIENVK